MIYYLILSIIVILNAYLFKVNYLVVLTFFALSKTYFFILCLYIFNYGIICT